MKENMFKYNNRSFLKSNVRYILIGIVVGLVIVVFKSAAEGAMLPIASALVNIMFSVVITLSIANSFFLFEYLLIREKCQGWLLILVYYSCNALGMLIGIEISYALVSLIFNVPFHFLQHYQEYRFCAVIVLVVGTIIYFYHAQKGRLETKLKEKELDMAKLVHLKTQAELQTLQSKINPHFLYNSLNSIASLIHDDADKAEDMTLKLSKLFRYSINTQQENMASVKEEIEIVDTYLDIEKVRFGDRIKFIIQVNPDVSEHQMPRFLIQPLVENALKHGLNNKPDDGILQVLVDKDGNNIVISIADNGVPFPDDMNMGYGLQSTYDKLGLLYGDNYSIQLTNVPHKNIKITIPA
ncbi:sensor histidine kinase [Mucilaginibacter boryungensis]|uniref:Histidine kinase n=1 Tax=Mucilaginibacter boryungensis TaxID=768480 RepID=A0ABR9XM69_9SPHI|nr:histidine kinase [Mucilaginibacter boryungensis]MBE9668462.1 histidine kinase [Mucilaginibacter boryungensis]